MKTSSHERDNTVFVTFGGENCIFIINSHERKMQLTPNHENVYRTRNSCIFIVKITTLILGLITIVGAYAAPVPEARTLKNEPLRFGNYEVYFSAFNSTFLTPDIAQAYQLQRGPRQGLVNIAVRNVKDSEVGTAVSAKLEGHHKNLLQQQSGLKFQEIREGSAIYYLAGFQFSNEEMLEFSIDVKPDGSDRSQTVQFRQQFYQDGK